MHKEISDEMKQNEARCIRKGGKYDLWDMQDMGVSFSGVSKWSRLFFISAPSFIISELSDLFPEY